MMNGTSSPLSTSESDEIVERVRALLGRGDAIEGIYSLSPLQESMLFHSVASPAKDLYSVLQRIDIDGRLDLPVFERAWNLVIDRHPALRTLFFWEHTRRPVQIVCREIGVTVHLIDLSDDPLPDDAIDDRIEESRRRRFSLDRPPVMRIVVIRRSPGHHTMLWSHHHIVMDGWSAGNVLREVFTTYEALRDLHDPGLAAVRPFSDFITWRETLDEAAEERFWRGQLEGFREPTRIARAGTRADTSTETRDVRVLSQILTAALHDLAASSELSLNSVLTGTLAVALGRHTGTHDVALGIVASGRPASLSGVEAMVGMFINTLVLRLEIDEKMPAAQWLAATQDRLAALLDHDQSALTDIQRWSELGSGTTLTDTLFAFWNFDGSGSTPGGDISYRTVSGYGTTSFPFAITVESADPISISIVGDVDPTLAERFLDHYSNLLSSLVSTPDDPVGSLSMLTETERNARAAFNDTTLPVAHTSVLDAFRSQVERTPGDTAIRFGTETLTFEQLDEQSQSLANHIIQMTGFAARCIAIYLPRSAHLVIAMLAVLKAGAAYLPIDRHLPRQRIEYVLDDSDADLIITTSDLRDQIPGVQPDVLVLPLGDPPSDLDAEIPIGPEEPAYVMYTSGSTGHPKGVVVTHEGLSNYVAWARNEYGGDAPVSFPLYTSPGFDLTVTSIFLPLVSGGEIVIYPDDDERHLTVLDVFEDDRVDVVKLTPSHLALLEDRHLKTARIRALVLGGEDLRVDVARSVSHVTDDDLVVFNEYGPTEATVGCMVHRFDPDVDVEGSVPIGRPIANSQIHLLDRGFSPTPVGIIGEIFVSGSGVAKGYLNDPAMTADRFVQDPFEPSRRMYRTGDLGRWREPGIIEYVGRSDDQFKIRGVRIEPAEIETALCENPAVSAVAVAAREAIPGDVRLVAYYVSEPGQRVSISALRAHLRDRLPDHMVPRHLVALDAIPLTPNGKIDRSALPDTIGRVVTSNTHRDPRTGSERLIARMAAELLGLDRVSIGDNFFEIGGHSILAMRLIAQLHTETGVRLSPRLLLLNTLEQAATQLPGEADITEHTAATTAPETVSKGEIVTSAYFFGSPESPLFGIQYSPSGPSERRRAVLLCPPLGWEYMRTHWVIRRIARLAASDGFHVMRFDYYGTGDSSGNSSAGSVERWVTDIADSAAELIQAGATDDISIVGVRMGASLAAVACSQGLAVDQLILWDPIIDGRGYMSELERMHSENLGGRRVAPDAQGDELLGFPYPPERRQALESIRLAEISWPQVPTTLVATDDRDEYRQLATRVSQMNYDLVRDESAWEDVLSTQATLLPRRIPGLIRQTLAARP